MGSPSVCVFNWPKMPRLRARNPRSRRSSQVGWTRATAIERSMLSHLCYYLRYYLCYLSICAFVYRISRDYTAIIITPLIGVFGDFAARSLRVGFELTAAEMRAAKTLSCCRRRSKSASGSKSLKVAQSLGRLDILPAELAFERRLSVTFVPRFERSKLDSQAS